jgi:hypothetical protein
MEITVAPKLVWLSAQCGFLQQIALHRVQITQAVKA